MKVQKRKTMIGLDFHLSSPAVLSVKNEQSSMVHCEFTSEEGLLPTSGKIHGHFELLKAAYFRDHAKLTMVGSKFRVRIIGINWSAKEIIVESAPIFRALAKLVKEPA